MFDLWNAPFNSLDPWGYLGFMVETRIAPRHRVMKAGTIEFGSSAIDCMVRNLSITGAALEVSNQIGIPAKFTLVVPGDGLNLACNVVWRSECRIGVAFD
jgi:PilZ domain